MRQTILLTISLLLTFYVHFLSEQSEGNPSHQGAECFYGYTDSLATHTSKKVDIQSDGAMISGELFLPGKPGPHPAIVLVHGGGSNIRIIRDTPHFFAPRLAHCGFAALVYDKRGTGESGGDYASSTFDDFITDAGKGVELLANHKSIDTNRIGIVGFSQGGRLAPVIAVRYPDVDFAVSVSGPLTSVSETRLYALENSFIEAGVSDSTLQWVMPLWQQHFKAISNKDKQKLQDLDKTIAERATQVHPSLLPPLSDALPRTGIYNSIGRDYVTELSGLSVPWFSLYGEADVVVPVTQSVELLHERMKAGDNDQYEVKVVPNATHSFVNTETRRPVGFEEMVMEWLQENVSE